MRYSDQKKGMLLAFGGIMFITPDSLLIRLANISSWNLIFYRGFIPFLTIFIGLLIVYRSSLFKKILDNGWHGLFFILTFAITSIVFVISIENTNVANTLVMIALAPMLSAIISLIFLKENPDKKTWIAIIITTLAVIYIFYDAIDSGDFLGNFLGLVCATGLAVNAVIIRSAKKISLVPSAMIGKLIVALFAFIFVDQIKLENNDLIIVPLMCVACIAIPFVCVTLAPRYITAAEVNLFFLLETIFGPFWVWLVIKEQPSFETIIGGGIIIATITIHSALALKKN
jgi:drug/metabolite transporter (DMT)-like permease|tara:strand:- start:562 stop:1419 length:858 start_codon:yes stop_codon:yes gene_type:complete